MSRCPPVTEPWLPTQTLAVYIKMKSCGCLRRRGRVRRAVTARRRSPCGSGAARCRRTGGRPPCDPRRAPGAPDSPADQVPGARDPHLLLRLSPAPKQQDLDLFRKSLRLFLTSSNLKKIWIFWTGISADHRKYGVTRL